MNGLKNLPRSSIALVGPDGMISQPWWRFINLLFSKPVAASAQTVSASPYTFTATQDGALIVQGGTVSAIAWERGATSANVGVTAGVFPIKNGDSIEITYTVAPTVTLFPD